jgi:hypothetical protein
MSQHHPFVLDLVILKAQNVSGHLSLESLFNLLQLPVGDIRTSDPYVKIKLGNKIIQSTSVIRFTLSPEWKEEFHIPLLHLFSLVTLEIWDHDEVRPHKMLGKVELRVEMLPIDGAPVIYESGIQKGESNIAPRGLLFYSASIQVRSPSSLLSVLLSSILSLPQSRSSIITVKSSSKSPISESSSRLLSLLSPDFKEFNTSLTVQETLQDTSTSFLTSNSFHWSSLRDMLCDINQLVPPLSTFTSSAATEAEAAASLSAVKWKRLQNSQFSNSIKLNLLTKTTELVPPMVKDSFVLQTSTDRYTLIASNKFALWNWILAIKRATLIYLQNHPCGDKNYESHMTTVGDKSTSHFLSTLRIFYQYHHYEDHCLALGPHTSAVHSEDKKNNQRYFQGNLILHTIGLSNISCQCTLDSETMVLSCQAQSSSSEPPINLSLSQLVSISISRDYPTHQPYDLQCTCVSGRVSVINLASAVKQGKNVKEFDVKPLESQEEVLAAAATTGWSPGRILIEGTKLTTSVVKTVVKGTFDGTTTLAKGTAELATSAAEGLVSIPIAAVGLSLQRDDISFSCIINTPYARDLSTPSITGLAPYWGSSHHIKLDQQTLHESNSFGVHEGPSGVILHLLATNKSEATQYVLGSKFIPYTEIIPRDSLSFADDHAKETRGGVESNVRESTFALDCDIAFLIDVVKGRNLLPPPKSNSMSTILTHPLDSFVKLSTLATSTVTSFASSSVSGSVTPAAVSSDRQPRVSCSFVKWKGSPVLNGKVYR